MNTDESNRLIVEVSEVAKQLNRIAEVHKINLWLKMESLDNERQKGIVGSVLLKL